MESVASGAREEKRQFMMIPSKRNALGLPKQVEASSEASSETNSEQMQASESEPDEEEEDDEGSSGSPGGQAENKPRHLVQLQQQAAAACCRAESEATQIAQVLGEPVSLHKQLTESEFHRQLHHQDSNKLNKAAGNNTSNGDGHDNECEEVKQVELFGVRIVALTINGKERLCLAQISNTLLNEFSYNEIHNRRVALGITCIQCTPIQLEMLRRAGAMPSSSRRCGMITMREAERLCRSFLVEEQTPELPENFYFTVAHRVNYGCKGRFIPARYISSRAKCIECFYCGEFYSPNKFIFHSHRQPHVTDCNPPDSPNINSWRKHIDLDWTLEHSQETKYAWEDVKSLFNGGTRRRAVAPNVSGQQTTTTATTITTTTTSGSQVNASRSLCGNSNGNGNTSGSNTSNRNNNKQLKQPLTTADADQLIDVECDDSDKSAARAFETTQAGDSNEFELDLGRQSQTNNNTKRHSTAPLSGKAWPQASAATGQRYGSGRSNGRQMETSLISLNEHHQAKSASLGPGGNSISVEQQIAPVTKRLGSSQSANKRFAACNMIQDPQMRQQQHQQQHHHHRHHNERAALGGFSQSAGEVEPSSLGPINSMRALALGAAQAAASQPSPGPATPFGDFLNPAAALRPQVGGLGSPGGSLGAALRKSQSLGLAYPASAQMPTTSPSFIYSQLYNQLMQPQQQQQQANQQQQHHQQQQQQQQQQLNSAVSAQLALRHHLWSSLLANLQCNVGANSGQTYGLGPQQAEQSHCSPPAPLGSMEGSEQLPASANHLSQLISAQLYSQAPPNLSKKLQSPQVSMEAAYNAAVASAQGGPFSLHKLPASETSEM